MDTKVRALLERFQLETGIPVGVLTQKGNARHKKINAVRAEIMYLMQRDLNMNTKDIGKIMGVTDASVSHATISYRANNGLPQAHKHRKWEDRLLAIAQNVVENPRQEVSDILNLFDYVYNLGYNKGRSLVSERARRRIQTLEKQLKLAEQNRVDGLLLGLTKIDPEIMEI